MRPGVGWGKVTQELEGIRGVGSGVGVHGNSLSSGFRAQYNHHSQLVLEDGSRGRTGKGAFYSIIRGVGPGVGYKREGWDSGIIGL